MGNIVADIWLRRRGYICDPPINCEPVHIHYGEYGPYIAMLMGNIKL